MRNWKTKTHDVYDRRYTVIALDGTRHVLEIRYIALFQWEEYQTGKASTFTDDRNCHLATNYELRREQKGSYHEDGNGAHPTILENDFDKVLASPSVKEDQLWSEEEAIFVAWKDALDDTIDLAGQIEWDWEYVIPSAALVSVSATIEGIHDFGNTLGRLIGLKKGLNCQDAAPFILGAVNSYGSLFTSKSRVRVEADYYLGVLDVLKNWKYRSETGEWVPAFFVYPDVFDSGTDSSLEFQKIVAGNRLGIKEYSNTEVQAMKVIAAVDGMHNELLEIYNTPVLSKYELHVTEIESLTEELVNQMGQPSDSTLSELKHAAEIYDQLPRIKMDSYAQWKIDNCKKTGAPLPATLPYETRKKLEEAGLGEKWECPPHVLDTCDMQLGLKKAFLVVGIGPMRTTTDKILELFGKIRHRESDTSYRLEMYVGLLSRSDKNRFAEILAKLSNLQGKLEQVREKLAPLFILFRKIDWCEGEVVYKQPYQVFDPIFEKPHSGDPSVTDPLPDWWLNEFHIQMPTNLPSALQDTELASIAVENELSSNILSQHTIQTLLFGRNSKKE